MSSIGSGAGVGVVVVVGGLSVEKQVRGSNQSEASLGSMGHVTAVSANERAGPHPV